MAEAKQPVKRGARRPDHERTGVMVHNSKQEIYRELQKEIQTPSFLRRFNRFKTSHPELNRFNTPLELVDFFNKPNPFTLRLKTELVHLLVSDYQIKPESKGWLMSLFLLVLWKKMEHTFYRFGKSDMETINPYDHFAPVYESYIDALLEVSVTSEHRFTLHLKDRAEYLIREELKECNRFRGEPDLEIPAPESLPWQEEIDDMLYEWTSKEVLGREDAELVIYRIVYEYTFKELAGKFKSSPVTLRQQFHRAVEKLKPFLQEKYSEILVTKQG